MVEKTVRITIILFFEIFYFINGHKPDSTLDKFKPYESFVEIKGGEFMMGINDREGVNHEYPLKKAKVKPFRYSSF